MSGSDEIIVSLEGWMVHIAVISLALTFLSIVFAFLTGGQLKSQLKKLVSIEKSITTRSIGEYPEHLDDIAALISKAKKSIKIAGIVSYGATFYKERYENIKSSIVGRCGKVKEIKIISEYGEKLDEFRIDWINDLYEKSELMKVSFNEYLCRRYEQTETKAKLCSSKDELRELVEKDNIFSLRNFVDQPKIELFTINEQIPVHFWLIDDLEAIFVIKTFPTRNYYAFSTRDAGLIKTLTETWDDLTLKAVPLYQESQIDELVNNKLLNSRGNTSVAH